jgi:5-methylcytosine-specific restriction endonuclease McrA
MDAINDFEHQEDKNFFLDFLKSSGIGNAKEMIGVYFDFRDPKIKRVEFNAIRFEVFKRLSVRDGLICQLRLVPDCSQVKVFEIDHFIPLSTNQLNKKLRGMKGTRKSKVPAQSFGSNKIENLLLACKRCNSYKKHRLFARRKN